MEEIIEVTESQDSDWTRQNRVKVECSTLSCKEHGRDVPFLFDYSTRTYHHFTKFKNGAISLCKSSTEIKQW